jgi:hypothetical protein
VHNIGHFRYLECSHVTEDEGRPDGDITIWDEIRFPFDPALASEASLDAAGVSHSEAAPHQTIEESYSVDATGLVEVKISNLSAEYSRTYRLGRWAAKPTPIVPARRRRARAEGRS